MGRRATAGWAFGVAGALTFAACGDDGATSVATEPTATSRTELAGVVPTTRAVETVTDDTAADDPAADHSATESTATAATIALGPEGGRWITSSFAGNAVYVGPPLQPVIERTTDAGIVVHGYAQPYPGAPTGGAGGPGWSAAPWCAPIGSLHVTMRHGEAVGVGTIGTLAGPFGDVGVEPLVAGYLEGAPFTVLVVQATPGVDSVAATFPDGTVDAVEVTDGLAILAAPTAPTPEDMMWVEGHRAGPTYTLAVHRGADVTEVASADLPQPTEQDYARECNPPTALPAPGEQPADPAAAEQAVRDVFDAVFDLDGRLRGDHSWFTHLDSDEGVEAAIDAVLAGPYGDAAGTASYELGDVVFTSPTEAWFMYDLAANGNRFAQRFGLAVEVGGTWKLSRSVICQDLALGGGTCEPPIGQLYPPTD